MSNQRKKFELSPRLRLAVGRGHSNKTLKISAVICLTIAAVLAGHALWLITKGNPAITPQVLGVTDIKTPNEQTAESDSGPNVIDYKVNKGDTLFNISQKFNISWATLATLNNLQSPFSLKPGQVIKIPQ